MEKVFNKMAAGGKMVMPLAKQFWGATFGMLQDKYGVSWMFNCESAATPDS
jgi:PhnB protein